MYAVVATGGKQYRFVPNRRYWVEKIEAEVGQTIVLDQVLFASQEDGKLAHGAPYIKGMTVTAEVLEQGRAKKIRVIKFRRRKDSKSQAGHRQWRTYLKIISIGEAKAPKKAAAKPVKKASDKEAS